MDIKNNRNNKSTKHNASKTQKPKKMRGKPKKQKKGKKQVSRPKPQQPQSLLRMDKITCYEGDGFCYYTGTNSATKQRVICSGKVSAEHFEEFLERGFNPCVGGFEREQVTDDSQCKLYYVRVLGHEFKMTSRVRGELRRFQQFLEGRRGLLTRTQLALSPVVPMFKFCRGGKLRSLKSMLDDDFGEDLTDKIELILESVEDFLRMKNIQSQLFELFKEAIKELKFKIPFESLQEFNNFKVTQKGDNMIKSNYFNCHLYRNLEKKIMTKKEKRKLPKLYQLASVLKPKFKAVLQKWRVMAGQEGNEPLRKLMGCKEIRLDPRSAEITLIVEEEPKNESEVNPFKEKSTEIESRGRETDPFNTSLDQDTEEEDSKPPEEHPLRSKEYAIDSYELHDNRFKFKGPPQSEWYRSIPMDPYEAKPRKFTTKLVKACYTTQKFELFNRYNEEVHNKTETTPKFIFNQVICKKQIKDEKIRSKVNKKKTLELGYHHLELYLDGVLVGVDCFKVTKSGILACAFFYEPELRPLRLGLVAINEKIKMVQELNPFFEEFKFIYLGYYNYHSTKINYKAKFKPLEVRCPFTNQWVRWNTEVKRKLKYCINVLGEEDPNISQGKDASEEFIPNRGADELFGDLLGYLAQMKSSQAVYLPKTSKATHLSDENLYLKVGQTEYRRLIEEEGDIARLMTALRISSLPFFRALGLKFIKEITWRCF